MPAFVGAISIVNIGSASVFHIGDVYAISPKATAKTFAGAGSFNTGDGLRVYNQQSSTNVNDKDVADQNIAANA
ncbi:spore germination protein [Bacillus songklensis]|uniref:Spore germination protein n=1 Tax=Bacillus songklensis TaxID=1069116 RepID=A0ABV8B0A6_9BACI